MLIPSPAMCPSADAGGHAPSPQSRPAGSNPGRSFCFNPGGSPTCPRVLSVGQPVGPCHSVSRESPLPPPRDGAVRR